MATLRNLIDREVQRGALIRACERTSHDDKPTTPRRLGDTTYPAVKCGKCGRIKPLAIEGIVRMKR